MDQKLLTRQGHDRLKKQLKHLRSVELPQNVKAIEEARAHGDLSENAEFHAAKERQAVISAKIYEIEETLAMARVIDPLPETNGRVVFGAKVVIYDVDSDEEMTWQVVGQPESDPDQGKISLTSPIGQALLGKEEGDEVKVKTPGGIRTPGNLRGALKAVFSRLAPCQPRPAAIPTGRRPASA